jgi:hypothetical protein
VLGGQLLTLPFAGPDDVKLIGPAGEQYRAALPGIPWPHEVPMQGLGIGRQLG